MSVKFEKNSEIKTILEKNEVEALVDDKMDRYVIKLVKNADNTFKLTNLDGQTLTFNDVYNATKMLNKYVVMTYGSSKLRPQYVSTNEMIFNGLDTTTENKILRVVFTPNRLSYETKKIADEDNVDELNSQIANIEELIASGSIGGSGLSDIAKSLLITILRKGVYQTDQSNNINTLERELYKSPTPPSGKILVYISATYNGIDVPIGTDITTLDITVTAYYSDDSTEEVTDYVISGEIVAGANVITIRYNNKSTTITVNGIQEITSWLYHFDNNLYAEGSNDFGLVPSAEANLFYADGKFGKAIQNINTVSAQSTILYAENLENKPTFNGDFTISIWAKARKNANNNYIISTCDDNTWGYNAQNMPHTVIDSNYTVSDNAGRIPKNGLSIYLTTTQIALTLANADMTKGKCISFAPANGLDLEWHNYALTRKDSTIRFFIDGNEIIQIECADELYSNNRIIIDGYRTAAGAYANSQFYIDELLIDDENCRYDSSFTVPTEPYQY